MPTRPPSHCSAHGKPPTGEVVRLMAGVGLLRRLAEAVVGVDDQRGQQVFTCREVAVDRRGAHPDLAGDGTDRQPRSPLDRDLVPGCVLDGCGQVRPGDLSGRDACAHHSSMPEERAPIKKEITALDIRALRGVQ